MSYTSRKIAALCVVITIATGSPFYSNATQAKAVPQAKLKEHPLFITLEQGKATLKKHAIPLLSVATVSLGIYNRSLVHKNPQLSNQVVQLTATLEQQNSTREKIIGTVVPVVSQAAKALLPTMVAAVRATAYAYFGI